MTQTQKRPEPGVKSEVSPPCLGSETHRDSQLWPVLVVTVA